MLSFVLLAALAALQVQDTVRPAADAAAVESAYLDEAARELVRLARERRRLVDVSIVRYRAMAQERISLGLRALRRERLFFRREVATSIDWTRDGPIRMEVLGAREVIPPVLSRAQVPEDLDAYVPRLAFDPADSRMMIGWEDDDFVRHPLADGSEADYRFRSGDTTVIVLADGRRVRLRELQILPRRKDVHLIRGSFWLDAESYAVVQAGFRLADEFDLDRDDDDPDNDDVPGILKPIRARVDYVTIEYGLWDLRWWLPRLIAFEGSASVGRFATLPLLYERVYGGYEVEGTPERAELIPFEQDSLRREEERERCRSRMTVRIRVGDEERHARSRRMRGGRPEPPDSVLVSDTTAEGADTTRLVGGREALGPGDDPCDRFVVTVADSVSLLTSEHLPPDPYASGVAMVPREDVRQLVERLKDAAPVPWQLGPPTFEWGLGGPDLVRYNRVEALSIGARGELDLGRLTASGTVRVGVGDLEPNAELTLARETIGARYELTSYRRLVSMDSWTQPFTFPSSMSALLLGRDETHYFRTLGGELRGRPAYSQPQWYDWRLYAQRERAAEKETDFSVRHLLDEQHVFPENVAASAASQYGASLTLRTNHGHDPLGFRWGAELALDGATGTFDYARPALTLYAAAPLPGRYVAALEVAGGGTFGHGGEQHRWRLGGPATLRGYPASVSVGEAFWRARAEIGTQFPAARVVVFSDAGIAAAHEALRDARPLLSAGIGASLLDGFFRLDLARALRAPTGWRLTFYVDGRL